MSGTATGDARALQLLRDTLPTDVHLGLMQRGYVDVPSTLYPNRKYRVYRNPNSSTTLVLERDGENWCAIGAACAVPADHVPTDDAFLTVYLAITADENRFLQTAVQRTYQDRQAAVPTIALSTRAMPAMSSNCAVRFPPYHYQATPLGHLPPGMSEVAMRFIMASRARRGAFLAMLRQQGRHDWAAEFEGLRAAARAERARENPEGAEQWTPPPHGTLPPQ